MECILDSHRRALQKYQKMRDLLPPVVIPRIPLELESTLPREIQRQLSEARASAARMLIPPERVWVHESWNAKDVALVKGCIIWTHSADVGVYGPQRIPCAANNGFPQKDNFTEPLIPGFEHEPHVDTPLFNVDRWVQDIYKGCLDPSIMLYMLTGAPQSYMGPLSSFVHENYPLDADTNQQFLDKIGVDSTSGRCEILRGVQELRDSLPFYRTAPLGQVPKDFVARKLIEQGLPGRRRAIQDASKVDPGGASVNNCTPYEHLHRVTLPKVEGIIDDILWMADRLYEFNFPSHRGRIRCWKRDIKSAYRWLLLHPPDQWLSLFSIPDPSGEYTLFVKDLVSAFGFRAAVTVWCRFAYAITCFTSQPLWAPTHFPQLSLPIEDGDEFLTEPPPADTVDLNKFKNSDHGCLDPKVGLRRSDYIDDAVFFTLNVHFDPHKEFAPCSKSGIRNPAGQMESAKFGDWRVKIELQKRKENGPRLSGLRVPVIIGFAFDLDDLRISLTKRYAKECIECINTFRNGNSFPQSAKIWNRLAGKLTRVVIVYPCTKCLMREIWTIAAVSDRTKRKYRASLEVLSCLQCFLIHLRRNPGRDMRHDKQYRSTFVHGLDFSIGGSDAAHGLSDASQRQLAVVNVQNGVYYFRRWHDWELQWSGGKIVVLEAIAAFYLFRLMAHHITNTRLVLWGDHEGNTASFNNAACGNTIVNAIIRLMSHDLAVHNIALTEDKHLISFNHCTTAEMGPYADALSRNREDVFLQQMSSCHPTVTPRRLSETHNIIVMANFDLHDFFLLSQSPTSGPSKRKRKRSVSNKNERK